MRRFEGGKGVIALERCTYLLPVWGTNFLELVRGVFAVVKGFQFPRVHCFGLVHALSSKNKFLVCGCSIGGRACGSFLCR